LPGYSDAPGFYQKFRQEDLSDACCGFSFICNKKHVGLRQNYKKENLIRILF
jgi:hypothetical protein